MEAFGEPASVLDQACRDERSRVGDPHFDVVAVDATGLGIG
jgi:hypothetical protein